MQGKPPPSRARTAGRIFAAACLAAYFALLAHKGYLDVTAVAQQHPDDFWRALGRHLLRNLGGG